MTQPKPTLSISLPLPWLTSLESSPPRTPALPSAPASTALQSPSRHHHHCKSTATISTTAALTNHWQHHQPHRQQHHYAITTVIIIIMVAVITTDTTLTSSFTFIGVTTATITTQTTSPKPVCEMWWIEIDSLYLGWDLTQELFEQLVNSYSEHLHELVTTLNFSLVVSKLDAILLQWSGAVAVPLSWPGSALGISGTFCTQKRRKKINSATSF